MPIQLKCPNGHTRGVGVEFAGKQVVCDVCAHVWNVPLPPAKGSGGMHVVRPSSPPTSDARSVLSNTMMSGTHPPPAAAAAAELPASYERSPRRAGRAMVPRGQARCPFCDHVGAPNVTSSRSGGVSAVAIVSLAIVVMIVPLLFAFPFVAVAFGGRWLDSFNAGVGSFICPTVPIASLALLFALVSGDKVWSCRACGVPWGRA